MGQKKSKPNTNEVVEIFDDSDTNYEPCIPYACGSNLNGELSLESSKIQYRFLQINFDAIKQQVKFLRFGRGSTYVVTKNNDLYVIGRNNFGQLGLGDEVERRIFTKVENGLFSKGIKDISCGFDHVVILLQDGKVLSCGSNQVGQLCLYHNDNVNVFTEITHMITGLSFESISCGGYFTYLITTYGELYSCGQNTDGQLGLESEINRSTLKKVPIDFLVKEVRCGLNHTIILTTYNEVYVAGYNSNGQLGLGHKTNQNTFRKLEFESGITISEVFCGAVHTIFKTSNGEVYVCGGNKSGQLGMKSPDQLSPVQVKFFMKKSPIRLVNTQMSNHTVVVTQDNKMWVCGRGEDGQLGNGLDSNVEEFQLVKPSADFKIDSEKILQVMALDKATFVITGRKV
ncbi:ultraviolet-B receptor UVR8 [Acrasis kona]|uniref:Ultraviolet-B receptor UVR8 n=1 Tax=Acrasis kona TaxID=1008807 RepID=A0AAW2YXN3_9EUKA